MDQRVVAGVDQQQRNLNLDRKQKVTHGPPACWTVRPYVAHVLHAALLLVVLLHRSVAVEFPAARQHKR